MSAQEIAQDVANALSLGSTYALLALGLAMLFSIMGLINFAHGELLTIGGYSMWVLSDQNVPWVLIVPAVIVITIAAALLMERIAFRPMRGAGVVTLLLTSFAVSFFIQNLLSIAVSPRPQGISVPDGLSQTWRIAGVTIPVLAVLTVVITLTCLGLLALLLRKTMIGIAIRAAAEDFPAVQMMGVRARRVVLVAFAISGALAGVAALLYFARAGSVNPTSGFSPIVKAFIVVVVGGLGSLSGAVAGGFLLGFLEVLLQSVLPTGALPFADALSLVLVIGILLVRPQGLFSRRVEVAT